MTITTQNIKILKSEVMSDTSDGGGQATAIAVVDGESNNLFPDISEASRAYGKIEIRKVYPAVDTNDTDVLFGAQFLFTKIPEDEKVNVCAFTTKSWTDRRSDAQNRLETYLAEGTRAQWEIMETQLQGQRAILLMGMENGSPPIAGQSLVLIMNEGEVTASKQYVRIVSVSTELRTFFRGTNATDTFKLAVHTCEITDPLTQNFKGFTPLEYVNAQATATIDYTRVRETRVADANNYYSAKKLTRLATKGDATLHVDSIYTNIVPSAQSESLMTDLGVSGTFTGLVKGSETATYTSYLSVGLGYGTTALGAGVSPDTFVLTLNDGRQIIDNGINQLFLDGAQVGTIQYDTGVITWLVSAFSYDGNVSLTYTNALAMTQCDQSEYDTVTEVNRGLLWNKTLYPAPTKGSVKVTYVNAGRHYTLIDNGDGSLGGATLGVGVGSINYDTGTIACTLNAYPDVGSYILYQWGDKVLSFKEAPNQDLTPYALLDINDFEAVFSGVYLLSTNPTMTWKVPVLDDTGVVTGQATKTATIDKQSYLITGDATGHITKDSARLHLSSLVPLGTKFTLNFQGVKKGQKATATAPIIDSGQSFVVDLSGYTGEINPWSLEVNVPLSMADTEYGFIRMYDVNTVLTNITSLQLFISSAVNGDPDLFKVSMRANGHVPSQEVGLFSKSTRKITVAPQIRFKMYVLETYKNEWLMFAGTGSGSDTRNVYAPKYWTTKARTLVSYSGLASTVTVSFTDKPDVPTSQTSQVSLLGYGVSVKALEGYNLNPTTVSFRFIDTTIRLSTHNQVLRVNADNTTSVVGSYTGSVSDRIEVALTSLPVPMGSAPSLVWLSVGSVIKDAPKNKFAFYTPLAPIRNGSFQLVIRVAGQPPTLVSPNSEGVFDKDGVWGCVDYQTGFVVIAFKNVYSGITLTTATEVLGKSPYLGPIDSYSDITEVVGQTGLYNMVTPKWLYVSEISYNAIGLTYLPLSSDILGLDPVRLPADGRVPCFRKGDMVVVTEDKIVEIETPIAGMVVPVGETRLSTVNVKDALGKAVVGYTQNLTSGVVSLPQDFSMAGYEAPLIITATIQDLVVLSDVQVSGVLALNKVLTHNYGVGCLVSSVVFLKDLQARAYNKFHQASWTPVWEDEVQGETISATYNTVFYPIVVTNASAVKERWALIFTSPTSFRCIGEFVGEVEAGATSEDFSPKNPNTLKPYFTLRKEGWGNGGFVNGNVMRFNTDSATHPIWVVRTILQGESTDTKQGFTMQLRGDLDNELP